MQYRRRIKIAPGVQLNMSKGGISVTVGPRGLRYTFGRGKSDLNVGLPGTGFYFRKHIPPPGTGKTSEEKSAEKTARKARHNPAQEPKAEAVVQELVPALPPNAPPTEAAYREGALHFLQGDYRSAFDIFSRLEDKGYLADELLMTGLAASYLEEYDTAMDSLIALLEAGPDPLPGDPNSLTVRYLPDTTVIVPLTQFAELELPLNMNMAALLLAELLDARGRYEEVIDLIEGLFEVNPDDPALLLSLVDLYSRGSEFDKLHNLLVKYQHHLHGDDDISLVLMLFWGAALA
jgi:tetratricopeptide (TPR) repeat protein